MNGIELGDAELREKNQITVPSEVLDFLRVSVGDLLVFDESDGKVIVCKAVIRKIGDGKKVKE